MGKPSGWYKIDGELVGWKNEREIRPGVNIEGLSPGVIRKTCTNCGESRIVDNNVS